MIRSALRWMTEGVPDGSSFPLAAVVSLLSLVALPLTAAPAAGATGPSVSSNRWSTWTMGWHFRRTSRTSRRSPGTRSPGCWSPGRTTRSASPPVPAPARRWQVRARSSPARPRRPSTAPPTTGRPGRRLPAGIRHAQPAAYVRWRPEPVLRAAPVRRRRVQLRLRRRDLLRKPGRPGERVRRRAGHRVPQLRRRPHVGRSGVRDQHRQQVELRRSRLGRGRQLAGQPSFRPGLCVLGGVLQHLLRQRQRQAVHGALRRRGPEPGRRRCRSARSPTTRPRASGRPGR